jgi:hypothetical protein
VVDDELIEILTRSNRVDEWPQDEQDAYRGARDMAAGMAAVYALRASKIRATVVSAGDGREVVEHGSE